MSIFAFNKTEVNPEQTEVKTPKDPVTGAGANASIKEIAQQEGKDNGKEKVVVIDGPLSHVYTQALNIALANESVQIIAVSPTASFKNQEAAPSSMTGEEYEGAEYVYVLGDKITEAVDAMEAFDALTKAKGSGKYSKLHLAIEGALTGKMCKRLNTVMESAMSLGVNVVVKSQFGTEAAVTALATKIYK